MELERNPFEAAIKAGDKQLGLWISLCSGFGAEVTAPSGFDWALIDMEHSPNDYFSVLGQLQGLAPGILQSCINRHAMVEPKRRRHEDR